MTGRNTFQDYPENRRVTGEDLHAYGKRAAALWSSGGAPTLSRAVVEVVKAASSLTGEHVRRVIEFTNTEAHSAEFNRKEGTADRVIDFPGGPADPGEVLRSLNDGSSGHGVRMSGSEDYARSPPGAKLASAEEESVLRSLFPTSSSAEHPDPFTEARALRTKIAGHRGHSIAVERRLSGWHDDLLERLASQVKIAMQDGHHLSEVVDIWQRYGPPEFVKSAFVHVADRLLSGGTVADASALVASLQKTASPRPARPGHPLVADFVDYCSVCTKLAETRAEIMDADAALSWYAAFEKDAAGEGLIPAAGRVLRNAGDVAERVGDYVGTGLTGSSKGKLLGTAARGAVQYGVPAVAANELYRGVKYNPALQGAQRSVLGVIPGTSEYQQREYELATGGGMY